MLKAIRRFFTTCPLDCCNVAPAVASPVPVEGDVLDFGHGYRARQLLDGRWVLEVDGKAVDLVSRGTFRWSPCDHHYDDCIVDDFETLKVKGIRAMARAGI